MTAWRNKCEFYTSSEYWLCNLMAQSTCPSSNLPFKRNKNLAATPHSTAIIMLCGNGSAAVNFCPFCGGSLVAPSPASSEEPIDLRAETKKIGGEGINE